MAETKWIKFLSKSNRVIEVPDWDLATIRVFTLQKFTVLTDKQAQGYVEEEEEAQNQKPTFAFYPPYETLLMLVAKAEPSGVFDVEEMEFIVKKIEGYEEMETADCVECFSYMKKREEWLKNAAYN